jgi:NagD protein
LEAATGRRAYSVGKPSPFMMRAARKRLGLRTAETVMVGDTMETDIRGALELGFHTVLVLTGNTQREDLARYPYRPTLVVDSIAILDVAALAAMALAAENGNGAVRSGESMA